MERTEGLKEYVRSERYREALGLPEKITETYELLAQGEYNRNYVFCHPASGQKMLLRTKAVRCCSGLILEARCTWRIRSVMNTERFSCFRIRGAHPGHFMWTAGRISFLMG